MGIKDVNSNSDFAAMKREVSMETTVVAMRKLLQVLGIDLLSQKIGSTGGSLIQSPERRSENYLNLKASKFDVKVMAIKGLMQVYDWAPVAAGAPGQAGAKAKKAQAFSNKSAWRGLQL